MTDFTAAKLSFLTAINADDHEFASTLAFIEKWFEFTPTAFQNGSVANSAEQNQGSCKVFALSQLLGLNAEQTLRCFGEHYRDVLATPDIENHHNLRRVLREGTAGIEFDRFPLKEKV